MMFTIFSNDKNFIDAKPHSITLESRVAQLDNIINDYECFVSPANSFGFMDGGIDWFYRDIFGTELENKVKDKIAELPFGELPVGQALLLWHKPKYFIIAPIMRVPATKVSQLDIFLAARAIAYESRHLPSDIKIAVPGLGVGSGGLDYISAWYAMDAGLRAGLNTYPRSYTTWHEARQAQFIMMDL